MYSKVSTVDGGKDYWISVVDGVASIAEEVHVSMGDWPPQLELHPVIRELPAKDLIIALGGRVEW